jgi:hypothetical protein
LSLFANNAKNTQYRYSFGIVSTTMSTTDAAYTAKSRENEVPASSCDFRMNKGCSRRDQIVGQALEIAVLDGYAAGRRVLVYGIRVGNSPDTGNL